MSLSTFLQDSLIDTTVDCYRDHESNTIVSKLLANNTDLKLVKQLVAENATDISLNYNHPELKGKFDIRASFGGSNTADASDKAEHVAILGHFVYRSKYGHRQADRFAFCRLGEVDVAEGKMMYMQFMEDTLSSANSFRKTGRFVYQSHRESREDSVVDV
ncbi:hypothetical protein B0A54_10173 [Friedmanniomyces endolithicus]|uniref:SnoaL-like domain-containing protein n=1 Tax=Friedmanniomyces endolithicus TaxID=329885 RepID=A0A4U0UUC6_9PEZI|nr:hypothetical protein B0A54_10173 [Friedmanniomyces endolithicus]